MGIQGRNSSVSLRDSDPRRRIVVRKDKHDICPEKERMFPDRQEGRGHHLNSEGVMRPPMKFLHAADGQPAQFLS